MPGSTYRALETEDDVETGETSQVERFRDAAKSGSVKEEFAGLVALDTGLRAGAIGHLSEDWVVVKSDRVVIDVPYSQKCSMGVGEIGSGGDTTGGGVPCSNCRRRNTDRDWLPPESQLPDRGDCWVPKSEAGYKGRMIPVEEDDTQQVLLSYLKIHDDFCTREAVAELVKSVADRAGILEEGEHGERAWPTTHDLRDTFGHRLARKGFNRFEIKSVMGHATVEQADDYIDLSGRETEAAFDEKW
jgi:integrase